MATTPETLTNQELQATRHAAIQLLQGAESHVDWSLLIRRSVFTLGIYPLASAALKLVDRKRQNFWDGCQVRQVGRVSVWGTLPADQSEIYVSPQQGLGAVDLVFKKNGDPVLKGLISHGLGRLQYAELGKPDLSMAQRCREYIQQLGESVT